MWKKALWLYLGLYVLGALFVFANFVVKNIHTENFQPATLILILLVFLPAGVVAFGLRGKKVSILLTLLGLLIVAAPVAGILKFNAMSLATIGKALLFLPMIAGLVYFGYKRVFAG